jgi:hypothetical protein
MSTGCSNQWLEEFWYEFVIREDRSRWIRWWRFAKRLFVRNLVIIVMRIQELIKDACPTKDASYECMYTSLDPVASVPMNLWTPPHTPMQPYLHVHMPPMPMHICHTHMSPCPYTCVPMPMFQSPTLGAHTHTHAHGFWMDVGAMLLFMGGHGWAWVGIGFVHSCI